ncbi:MAG: hypothetical protein KTR27_13170 [Leptolyngbyaceae cyanobacterium MAG.088]|nr:hypothetical protein [Leptolyngbyaceae cyanobacterium MAG.088]
MTSTAYLLISHGSRDPRHLMAINRLAQLVRERLNPALVSPWSSQGVVEPLMVESRVSKAGGEGFLKNNVPQRVISSVMTATPVVTQAVVSQPRFPQDRFIVGTAVLDFGLYPLHQQICEFGRRLSSAGIERLHLVPLFLLKGKHVMQDIPDQVELARNALDGLIELNLGGHIGEAHGMPELITTRFFHSPESGRLIVAHGSRRTRGNRGVDHLAKSLGTAVAYWTKEADIETQAIHLMQQGCSTLTIFPYFLFAGGITDAVAHLTEELAERFPRTNFRLLPPLGATVDLANLVVGSLGHSAADQL